MYLTISGAVSFALALTAQANSAPAPGDFPIIDLEYARHKPTNIVTTDGGNHVARYSNIRYAQPPVGGLRFRRPVTPPPDQQGISDGSEYGETDCVSSAPGHIPFPGINGTHWGQEDCLFLNVYMPEGVKAGDDVPVIHWIHGGAFAFGSKDLPVSTLEPGGLLDVAALESRKFVFVASNYRLGLYGFSSSPDEPTMDANIGIHDSMAAVEWTRQHISKFGGDPERITVFGQSAGAAVINAMLTAYGGKGSLPFSQAIVSSPGLMPRRDVGSRRQQIYNAVLKAADCDGLDCLRSVPPHVLAKANNYLISEVEAGAGGGSYGPSIGFAPFPDGDLIPDEPMILLQQGHYHKGKQLMSSNMALEGKGISSDDNMPQEFPDLVRKVFPTASNETINKIKSLFPYPPDTPEKLAWDWTASIAFACHAHSLAKAYGDRGHRYVMSAPPATHGVDLFYIFFINNEATPVANPEIARQTQAYILQFISASGDDNPLHPPPDGLPGWPAYGTEFNTMDISEDGFNIHPDPWETRDICPTLLEMVKDPQNGN